MRKPEIGKAIDRLQRAAPHLLCASGHKYGGSIKNDLIAVLSELAWYAELVDTLQSEAAVTK